MATNIKKMRLYRSPDKGAFFLLLISLVIKHYNHAQTQSFNS